MKSIAVIYGCDSSEWEISQRSGEFTASRIDGSKYDVYEIFARFGKWTLVAYRRKNSIRIKLGNPIDIDKNDFSVELDGIKVKFDYAYIMQHGRPGENGLLQGYFEMLGIPFSSCSAFVSAITFDKYSSKAYLRDLEYVKVAEDIFIRKGDDMTGLAQKAVDKLGLPMFVKPTDGGSSFGVTKVHTIEEFDKAVDFAFAEGGTTVIVEKAISGREITCAAYRAGDTVKALPVVEIVTSHDYFDYDAKYNGESEEICPAPLAADIYSNVQDVTCKIYSHMGCSGVVRIDYILAEDGLYCLEPNTIPGMTAASLVPKMVRTAGLDMTDFLTGIIESR